MWKVAERKHSLSTSRDLLSTSRIGQLNEMKRQKLVSSVVVVSMS